jgi:hypothetical protein
VMDATAPTTTIACNGAPCAESWYTSAVTVSLSATDAGGSGVAETRYTTNGADPTRTSTLYTGPFSVAATTTVKFRSWDGAGNAEATKSQTIRVDATAPAVKITQPANNSTITGTVKIVAQASDAESGVSAVAFYLDGSLLATITSAPYQTTQNTRKWSKGKHVLTAVATNAAGNATKSTSVSVTVK